MINTSTERDGDAVSQRLVQAVWSLWETQGHAAISARLLARHASMPVSTLYHRFSSLDHLFIVAQEQAQAAARSWCSAQLSNLLAAPSSAPLPARGLGPIMAALIDDWVYGQRRLAFAWREGTLLAGRDERFRPAGQNWRLLWAGFWQTICALCNASAYGAWSAHVFEGEAALHMLPGRRVLDRACLDELCQGWASWVTGSLVEEGAWRGMAREQALASLPELSFRDDMTRRIAAGAASIVEDQGRTKLTHRAVAIRADVSLGMVSSRFPTSADLVHAAFEMIYDRLAAGADNADASLPVLTIAGADSPSDHGATHASRCLALDELMLAVTREGDLQLFAPQLRYLRGRTSRQVLQRMVGAGGHVSSLDAAIFSDLLSGMQRAGIDLSKQDNGVPDMLAAIIDMLGFGRTSQNLEPACAAHQT